MWAELTLQGVVKMNEFKNFHPVVNFVYFASVIAFSMILMHPVCVLISFVCGFAYSVMLGGTKALKFNFACIAPLALCTAAVNPAFSHEGMTILRYLPSGNPLTLESVVYGIAAAAMLSGVILHFYCFNRIMTSDKLMYLSGRIIPSLSLIFSMTLRFVPRFNEQMKEVAAAQECMGRSVSEGSLASRAKNGVRIISVMITRCMENAVDTANSMKSRGFGLPGRTAYSNFRFTCRDAAVLAQILVLTSYVVFGKISGQLHFVYFPKINGTAASPLSVSCGAAYLLLCMTPIIIEVGEALRWKSLKSKI